MNVYTYNSEISYPIVVVAESDKKAKELIKTLLSDYEKLDNKNFKKISDGNTETSVVLIDNYAGF